jgi:hypothetical protein
MSMMNPQYTISCPEPMIIHMEKVNAIMLITIAVIVLVLV